MWLDALGEVMWYIVRRGGTITGFLPMRGDWFKIKPAADGTMQYVYDPGNGKVVNFDAREIIYFRRPNPADPIRGLSLISAGAYSIDELTKMHKTRNALLDNDSTPPFGLKFTNTTRKEDIEALRYQFELRHKGSKKAGRVAFLPGDAEVVPFPVKFEELLYLVAMDKTREEICGICRVPLAKLGLVQDVNRANSEAMDATFMSETIAPHVGWFEDGLNSRLMPNIGLSGLRWKFDLDIPVDRVYELDETTRLLQAGAISINEARRKYGYPDIAGADMPLVPFSLVPLTYAQAPQDSGNDANPDNQPKALKKQLAGETRRKAAWKSFDSRVRPWERVVKRLLDDYFDETSAKVRANLRKAYRGMDVTKGPAPDIEALIPSEILEGIALAAKMSPIVSDILKQFLEDTAAQYGADGVFNPDSPRIAVWLGKELERRMTKIAATTADELRAAMTEGVRAGEGIDKIAQRVADAMNQAKSYRSVRIAQTEVIGASNRGTMEGLRAAGFERKEWLSSRDGRVRETHIEADGQIVALDSPFVVGAAQLDHPGDMLADAPEETINCRCTVVPVFGGEV